MAFLLAYGAVLLGVWAEFDSRLGPAIGAALTNTWKWIGPGRGSYLPLDLRATFFCFALAVTATLLWRRLKADDRRQEERTLAVLRAVHQVPNVSVMRTYPDEYWPGFVSAFQTNWPDTDLPEKERRAKMGRAIRDALAIIAAMAQHFAQGNNARYGANIMLVIGRGDDAVHPFPKKLVERLRFHPRMAVAELEGLLYLPDELVVSNLPGAKDRTIARIVLPVPDRVTDRRGHRLAIPGAPTAVLRGGGPSVHEDTSKIATECADFSAPIRAEIAHYFSPEGDGRDVASFASIRLGNELVPIGVLNVDSDRTHVLGLDDGFYYSFYAFLRPMIEILAEAVTEYAALLDPEADDASV